MIYVLNFANLKIILENRYPASTHTLEFTTVKSRPDYYIPNTSGDLDSMLANVKYFTSLGKTKISIEERRNTTTNEDAAIVTVENDVYIREYFVNFCEPLQVDKSVI